MTPERQSLRDCLAAMASPNAVEVRHLLFTYTRNYLDLGKLLADPLMRQVSAPVLKDVSLSVPKGTVFALLGPSGSGKTTLLKCILGCLVPNYGSISIFGEAPSLVQRVNMGFMPQELALYFEMTLSETFTYFGRLYGMSPSEIHSRIDQLVALLALPRPSQLVACLSGGQQRRVSLACALFHQPALLVLDEPTVGVDPLLRSTIWSHLESLTREKGVTVIVTTHYVEEARAAGTVAFMRDGRLLVQASPEVLLAEHALSRLENVLLKLCQIQDEAIDAVEIRVPAENGNNTQQLKQPTHQRHFSLTNFSACLSKNSLRFKRNLLFTLFYLLFASLQTVIYVYTVGRAPANLPVILVNADEGLDTDLSSTFVSFLNGTSILELESQRNVKEAERMVERGTALAVIHLGRNFSTAWDDRLAELADADNETIQASNVRLSLDMSNPVNGFALLHSIFLSIQSLLSHFQSSNGFSSNALSIPLSTHLVYGSLDLTVMNQPITPGFAMVVTFFTAAALVDMSWVAEQKSGAFERSRLAGVQPTDALLSHICLQSALLLIQQILLFYTIFYILAIPCQGPVALVFLQCFLQGIAGISYGALISSLCPDEIASNLLLVGLLLPSMLLSGLLWPSQAMTPLLYWGSLILPQTLSIESARSVLARGWNLQNTAVQLGFASTGTWIVVCLLLTGFVIRK